MNVMMSADNRFGHDIARASSREKRRLSSKFGHRRLPNSSIHACVRKKPFSLQKALAKSGKWIWILHMS